MASSSVRLALKTRSAVPKCSISFLNARSGLIPGQSECEPVRFPGEKRRCERATVTVESRCYRYRVSHVALSPRPWRIQTCSVTVAAIDRLSRMAHIAFGRIRKLMSRLKISAISYLNTAPLMWDFEHGNSHRSSPFAFPVAQAPPSVPRQRWPSRNCRHFEISYTIPSACARALREGTADIGIIPAAAYTTIPDLVIFPDVWHRCARMRCVAILLVSKMPIEQVRTVALDTSSLTSVALTKILFAKWLGGARDYTRDGSRSRRDAARLRRSLADWRPSAASRPQRLLHARSRGRMARAHWQVICLRFLGDSAQPRSKDETEQRSPECSRIRAITACCENILKQSPKNGRRASA